MSLPSLSMRVPVQLQSCIWQERLLSKMHLVHCEGAGSHGHAVQLQSQVWQELLQLAVQRLAARCSPVAASCSLAAVQSFLPALQRCADWELAQPVPPLDAHPLQVGHAALQGTNVCDACSSSVQQLARFGCRLSHDSSASGRW